MRVIDQILHVLAQYRAFRAALAHLDRRSDNQLAGLGIDRGDVVRIAFEHAERLPAREHDVAKPVPTWPPTATATAG